MIDPNLSSGRLDIAACHTLFHNRDGIRTDSLFDSWKQELHLATHNGYVRGTRNAEDCRTLLEIIDEALEIAALTSTAIATNDSVEQMNQLPSLQAETLLHSDDENQVSISVRTVDIGSTSNNAVRTIDIGSTSNNATRGRTITNVKRRRSDEKLLDMNRQ